MLCAASILSYSSHATRTAHLQQSDSVYSNPPTHRGVRAVISGTNPTDRGLRASSLAHRIHLLMLFLGVSHVGLHLHKW